MVIENNAVREGADSVIDNKSLFKAAKASTLWELLYNTVKLIASRLLRPLRELPIYPMTDLNVQMCTFRGLRVSWVVRRVFEHDSESLDTTDDR